MDNTLVLKTVYALYFQETRAIVEQLWETRPHDAYDEAWVGRGEMLPSLYLNTWRSWSGVHLGDQFPYAYPTAGASEAIKDLIVPPGSTQRSLFSGFRRPGRLHVFEGEYEGFEKYASSRGIETVKLPRDTAVLLKHRYRRDDFFFISNPSAIDGEYWDELSMWLDAMALYHPQVRIYLDVSYVGVVQRAEHLAPCKHPNVQAVIFSLSKPFGVYKHRIGGVFSREPIAALEGNRWFHNTFSLSLGIQLMTRLGVTTLPTRYSPYQKRAIALCQTRGEIPADAKACNAVLLAHAVSGPAEFARTDFNHRFCLTRAMWSLFHGKVS